MTWGLEKFAKKIEEAVSEAVRDSAMAVCERAKSLCDDDMSYRVLCDGNYARVECDDDGTKEFGTAENTPSPCLIPALIASEEDVVSRVADAIEEIGG